MNKERITAFGTVPVEVAIRVGGLTTTVGRLAELKTGDRLQLDRRIGEAFDLLVEGVRIGRVEPIACEDHLLLKLAAVEDEGGEP